MNKRNRLMAAVGVVAGVAAVATACSSPASSAPAGTPDAAAIAKGCDVGHNVTLNVGLSEAGDVIGTNFKKLTQEFEKQHPNVKVNVQAKDFASSLSTIKLVMSGDNPPDLMQGNSGWSINGALWKAHLIANLDPYAQHYGWVDKFPESALVVNRFSPDGKTLGEGNLVGVPQAIQYVGVFYNKKLLNQLGVTDPTSLDKAGLIASLDKAKAAGMTPVTLGDSDKWPALHNLSLFNGWYVPADTINQWVFNRAGSTYDDEGHLKGSTDFQNWMKSGYFNKDALATSFSDATAKFGKGESPYFITGTWALGDVEKALGNDAGFMLFPAGDSGTHEAVGGYSLPWTMSTKSKNPACAGQLLDFITTSSAAVDAQIASGRPSATKAGAEAQISDPLLTQMVQQYKKLSDDKGLFTWEDWPTPTMLQFMGSQAQLLLGGQLTPKAYNESIQKNWSDYMATR